MLEWLKHLGKEYPDFWKNYLLKIESHSTRKVAIYIETTGLNPSKDRICSIGAIAIEENQIFVEKSLEINLNNNSKETDLKYEEVQALEAFIYFIGNATLVGHRIHYDIEIINEYLSKLQCGRIKNELLDVEVMQCRILDISPKALSLENLLEAYHIKKPEVFTSGNYAYNIALLFLKMKRKLGL